MDEIALGRFGKVVTFTASDGLKLSGILESKSPRKKTCVIFLHGMSGSAVSNVSLALAKYTDEDYALFMMNNRGQGMVSGFSKIVNGKKKRLKIGTCFERFEDCIYDIKGAIAALRKLGYSSFILCGHSTGCQKAAYYYYKTHDRRVKALVLVAPSDDYNLGRKELGGNFAKVQRLCARMIKSGKRNEIASESYGFSAQRLDSIFNLKRIEARIFNYEGPLKEFSTIKIPVLAIFGSLEEGPTKPVDACLEMLGTVSGSVRFNALLVEGAAHSFEGMERPLVGSIMEWIGDL